MNRLLAVDCSNRWTSVGLALDNNIVAETGLDLGRKQASLLPLLVQDLLSRFDLSIKDLSSVAVTVGPGYFTGIRIAMAYIAAISEGLSCPVIPVSSLQALACSAGIKDSGPEEVLFPCIKAGRNAFYSGGFDASSMAPLLEEGEWSIDDLSRNISKFKTGVSRVVVTEKNLVDLISPVSVEVEAGIYSVTSITASAILKVAMANKDKACSSDELRAKYYRAPAIGGCS